MPRLTRFTLKVALVQLVLGFTVGALLLIQKAAPYWNPVWLLRQAHIEFLLFGWVVQLIIGIGFWIFPRYRTNPKRGKEHLAWISIVSLNLGVVVVSSSAIINQPALDAVGKALEFFSLALFAYYIWGRVKATETGRSNSQ